MNDMDEWSNPTSGRAAASALLGLISVALAFRARTENSVSVGSGGQGGPGLSPPPLVTLVSKDGTRNPKLSLSRPARKAENAKKIVYCGTNCIQAIENKGSRFGSNGNELPRSIYVIDSKCRWCEFVRKD